MVNFKSVIVAFFLLLAPQYLWAWSIAKIKGGASISRAGEIITAEKGFSLVGSDVVQTEARSRVLIQDGENRIWLGARTKFKVGEVGGRRNQDQNVQTLSVLSGKIRSIIKRKKSGTKQFKFRTPTAVAGVRGTEFFIESTESGEFFCTLDGSIEVETNDGNEFVVDEGKGLRLAAGNLPNLSGTSSLLVDRWVAETSFDDQTLVPEESYGIQKRKTQIKNKEIYIGGFGSLYYCGKENSDFDDSADDENKDCFRYVVSPFIQWGTSRKLFFRPTAVGTYASSYGLIDEVPAETKKEANAITVSEAYYEDNYVGWNFRLGLQDVEWADGILLSRKLSAIEPITHLALTARGQVGEYEVEVLGGPGLEDSNELEGHSHIATAGVKAKIPNDRGEVYILHTNFGERDGRSEQFHGQEFMNYGYFLNRRKGDWDYRFSVIHQDLHQFYNAIGVRGESQATSTDVSLGRQLNMARPIRVSVRHIKSGRNFIPVQEDFYTLSNGMIVSHRSKSRAVSYQA